jgi:UDP-GlcNAc:undecaprenyl-phosphate GlcNAc-1-phosphate transferase
MNFDLFMQLIVCAFVPFMAVVTLLPFVRRWAFAVGFIDTPGGRKKHSHIIPPVGGIVLFPVFIICSLAFGLDLNEHGSFLAALCLLLVVGAWDDRYVVNSWIKFAVQLIAAYMIILPGQAQIYNLGNLHAQCQSTIWNKFRRSHALLHHPFFAISADITRRLRLSQTGIKR